MGPRRIGGIVLLIVGLGLVYSGYQITQSASSQISQAFGGGVGDSAVIRYVAGAICIAVGGSLFR